MENKSYLIVGQGIAGSLLAWSLMKAGHRVVIVDDRHNESSSLMSAGIVNPITGQRLTVTPDFDLFSSHANQIYSQISAELGREFYIPKPIIRVLRSQDELERGREIKSYIKAVYPPGHYGKGIIDPFGTLEISQGGYFKTQFLLTALKGYFADRKMLVAEHFSYEDLKLEAPQPQWKEQSFDAVIFCEGFKTRQNPWFKDLPYNFVKGELLKITFDFPSLPDAILCQQQWCIPAADGSYLAGSTYDREHIDTTTTEEGQTTILKGLSDFISAKARVFEHYAGVRPVMLNLKPVAALHPTIPGIGIFNGFASKAFLWVPYYAEMFTKQLG